MTAPDGQIGEAVMPRVGGKAFRCYCGANVFTRQPHDIFRCNGCGELYEGVRPAADLRTGNQS